MDFGDTPEEAAFRREARQWLEAHAPRFESSGTRELTRSLSVAEQDDHERTEIAQAREWQHELYEGGWTGITWPSEYGGRGGTALEGTVFAEEQAAFDIPTTTVFLISVGMVGPTLIAHGTEEQRARHLAPILKGDEVWCQLFSEPNAGSDLAGIQTRADRTRGGWVVNGQKVWTTGARVARYGALVARSDTSVPKHRGLSYFVLDMSAPGIEIRPLRQANGDAHFNEVFLTDVHIVDAAVVGEVNDGWRVANTMLLSERGNFSRVGADETSEIVALAKGRARSKDPVVRQEIASIFCYEQVIRLLTLQARTTLSMGGSAPFVPSMTKLLTARKNQRLAGLALELLGPDGMIDSDRYGDGEWQRRFLNTPISRIAGGTDEIQKNVLAERCLGLPREARPDKGVPFNELGSAGVS